MPYNLANCTRVLLGSDLSEHRAHYARRGYTYRLVPEGDPHPATLLAAVVYEPTSVTVFAAVPTTRVEARSLGRSVVGSERVDRAKRTLARAGLAFVEHIGGVDADEGTDLDAVVDALLSRAREGELREHDELRIAAVMWERACARATAAGVDRDYRELLGQQSEQVPCAVLASPDGPWIVALGDQRIDGSDRESLTRFAEECQSGPFPRNVFSEREDDSWSVVVPSIEAGREIHELVNALPSGGYSCVGAVQR